MSGQHITTKGKSTKTVYYFIQNTKPNRQTYFLPNHVLGAFFSHIAHARRLLFLFFTKSYLQHGLFF